MCHCNRNTRNAVFAFFRAELSLIFKTYSHSCQYYVKTSRDFYRKRYFFFFFFSSERKTGKVPEFEFDKSVEDHLLEMISMQNLYRNNKSLGF